MTTAVQVQYRRGTGSQVAAFTGAQGEMVVDTTNNRVVVQDGSTAGGWPAAKLSEVQTNARTQVSDANYTAQTSDRLVAYIAITAARTVSLPAASAFPGGSRLLVIDESGGCSATNTITLAANGSDLIDGASSALIQSAYGYIALESNTFNKWTIVDATNGVTLTSPSITGGTINNTVIGATTPAAIGATTLSLARHAVSDANYTVASGISTVAYTAITAARTVTLPASSSFNAGQQLLVVDESGSCSATKTITINPNGTDKIDGASSAVVNAPYGYIGLESNASGNWTIIDQGPQVLALNGLTGGVTLAASDGTGISASGTTVTIGGPGGMVNKFRNGTMDVWQRGTSALTVQSGGTVTIGAIATLGTITGGSSYTNGTYTGVSLTGGSGSGAQATVVVASGAVSSVTITNVGKGYLAGNTLSASASGIGGTGSGFSVPVATVQSLSSSGYTADGWMVVPTGASVTVSQAGGRLLTKASLQATGATSVTDLIIKQRIESYIAAAFCSQTVTVQAQVYNNTGASITPLLTVKHAGSQDNWSSPTTDVNAVSLQACANGGWTRVAYAFSASASSYNGIEISFDFGNNFGSSSATIQITECDIRVTPGASTGLNSNPPPPELRLIATEISICQRYFQSSYSPGVAPGTAGASNALYASNATSNAWYVVATFPFPVPMRAYPTATSYSPNSGLSGVLYAFNMTVDVPAYFPALTSVGCGLAVVNTTTTGGLTANYTLGAEL